MVLQIFFKRHILLSRSKTTPTSIYAKTDGKTVCFDRISRDKSASHFQLTYASELHSWLIKDLLRINLL